MYSKCARAVNCKRNMRGHGCSTYACRREVIAPKPANMHL